MTTRIETQSGTRALGASWLVWGGGLTGLIAVATGALALAVRR